MRKPIVIVAGVAALGLGYTLINSWKQLDDAVAPPAMPEGVPEARIAPPAATVPPPAAPAAAEPEALAELDAEGDDHDVGATAVLQETLLPPAQPDYDADPVVGELAALQEARAIVQELLAEAAADPAARAQAEELLELIDSQTQ